ncbi:MAG: HNH endonuclease [Planctomycetes bacterium]|nr:HNH endonuclease [Planctomycetota bacterium]
MAKGYISRRLRREVWGDAAGRCGYCLRPQSLLPEPLFIEHIRPTARGGMTVRANLWLSCWSCNTHKGSRSEARDPLSGRLVRLFNPRTQKWAEHFRWSRDGLRIIGRTATGRATVVALALNDDLILAVRAVWVQMRLHPPKARSLRLDSEPGHSS